MTVMTENKTETFEGVDSRNVHVGDRLQFITRETGFNGRGLVERTGTVVKVTAKTVRVDCRGDWEGIAVLRKHLPEWVSRAVRRVVTAEPNTARTAADLPEGTRVRSADGRTGTVNGLDVGRVANAEHPNYGREYVGVTWDPTASIPWGQRSRAFVDELVIESTTRAEAGEVPFQPGERVVHADGRRFSFVSVNPEDSSRILVERPSDGRVVSWHLSECRAENEIEIAARHGETAKLHRDLYGTEKRKTPDLRQLANPKKADPETIAEIHASRCIECKGTGCPQCGYKGVQRTVCPAHHIVDKRGGRALELGTIPTCEPGITYGAWSEGAGGFVYTGDCATEVANWAADELQTLAKDDDTDTIQILAICPDHDEQPKNGCEECGTEDTNDDSGEDDSFQRSAHIGRIADEFGDEG